MTRIFRMHMSNSGKKLPSVTTTKLLIFQIWKSPLFNMCLAILQISPSQAPSFINQTLKTKFRIFHTSKPKFLILRSHFINIVGWIWTQAVHGRRTGMVPKKDDSTSFDELGRRRRRWWWKDWTVGIANGEGRERFRKTEKETASDIFVIISPISVYLIN